MPALKKNVKKWVVIFGLITLLIPSIYSQVFFDSEGGMALDTIPKADFKGVELNARAFYGAQMQLGYNILLETEFSFNTENIFGNIFLQEIPAEFNLDKLSFSYNLAGLNYNSRITAFAGTYDGVGTDQFAKKYFGAHSYDSPLFEKQIAYNQASIIPIDGFGLEMNTVFGTSFATAFYAYYNEKFTFKQLNFDLRFVGIGNSIIADFALGASLPFDNTDADGNDVILIVRRADLHTGLSMLIGNNRSMNLFLQAGVTRIQINPDPGNEIFSLEDLYAYLEPRFIIDNVDLHFAGYILPEDIVETIPYIEHTVGGLIYFNAAKNIGRAKSNFGAYISAGYADVFTNTTPDLSRFSTMITPYFDVGIGNGVIECSFPIKVLEFSSPDKMITGTISYTTTF